MAVLTVTPCLARSPGKWENLDLNRNLGPLMLFIMFLQFSFSLGGLTSLKSAPQNPAWAWGSRWPCHLGAFWCECTLKCACTLGHTVAYMGLLGAAAPPHLHKWRRARRPENMKFPAPVELVLRGVGIPLRPGALPRPAESPNPRRNWFQTPGIARFPRNSVNRRRFSNLP